jgi:hypothetical protein
MRKFTCVLAMLLCVAAFAQVKNTTALKKTRTLDKKKIELKHTTLGIGFGITRSVIFLSRNIKEFNDASGFNIQLVYGGNKLARFSAEYHQYNAIDIEPTWYNIHAKTYEANVQFLARFRNNKAVIYPLVGLSLNEFKGYFTGRDDFQNLRDKYGINTEVHSFWLGANFGLGYEHQLGPVKIFGLYKMRVGAQDFATKLNIMDVCYSFGLRYDFKALTPKAFYRFITRSYRDRYHVS